MRVLKTLILSVFFVLLSSPVLAVQLGGQGSTYPEKVPGTLEVTELTVTGTVDARGGVKFLDGTIQTTTVATSAVQVIFDGGDSDITTGIKTDVTIPFSCTIQEVTLLSSQEGSIVIDILKGNYDSFPPTASITASAKPTISSSNKSKDSTLTGWTTTLASGDILRFVVDSCTSIRNCTLSLTLLRN